jgi:hypothetical protein
MESLSKRNLIRTRAVEDIHGIRLCARV